MSENVDQPVSISDDEEAPYVIRALIKKIGNRCLHSQEMLLHALYKFLEHPDEVVNEINEAIVANDDEIKNDFVQSR